jgi:tetratricopeptide (TPR) repeat protein
MAAGTNSCATLEPALFHAVSVGLHLGCTLLVYHLLSRLTSSASAATAGTAVFAIHPLQVESVAWASEQRGLLAAMLSFAAVLQYLRWRESHTLGNSRPGLYITALLLFVAAVLAKPVAITAPLLALAWDGRRGFTDWKHAATPLVPWVVVASAGALLTRLAQPAAITMFHSSLPSRALIAGDAIAFYASKTILPIQLCIEPGRSPARVLIDPLAPAAAIAVLIALVAIFTAQSLSGFRLAVVSFLIPLLPVLGVVSFAFQNHSTVADRYAYMAMLGPAAAVTLAAKTNSSQPKRRAVFTASLVAWLGFLVVLSHLQVATWRNTGTLAGHACSVVPDVAHSWDILASWHLEQKNPEAALSCAERSLTLAPQNPDTLLHAAAALTLLREFEQADRVFSAALLCMPRDDMLLAELHLKRGHMLLDAHRDASAAEAFGKALGHAHDNPKARVRLAPAAVVGLAVAKTRIGEASTAITMLRDLVKLRPELSVAWVGLGNALMLTNSPREAIDCYDRAVALSPTDVGTITNRAWAKLEAGDHGGAIEDSDLIRRLGHAIDGDLESALDQKRPSLISF